MAENEKRKMTEKDKRYAQQKDKRAGDEKEKRKNTRLSGRLQPYEEILWESSSQEEVPMRERIIVFIQSIILATVFVAVGSNLSFREFVFNAIRGHYDWNIFRLLGPFIPVATIILGILNLFPRSRPEHIYAVTNQRLLFEVRGHDLIWFRLDDVISLNVVPEANKRFTLDFGKVEGMDEDSTNLPFPPWHNLMDAEAVKAIIDEAQAQRMWRNPN